MRTQHDTFDTYWNSNKVIGEGEIEGKSSLIRLRVHRSPEQYFDGDSLIKLSNRKGARIYFHAKPYILIPDMTLTIATYPQPAPDGAICEVISSDVKKLKPLEIGNAQAWYYPADKTVVLWECYLTEHFRQHTDPRKDATLQTLWTGFERILLEQLHPVERIYTTYEPIYEVPVYEKFLRQQGYRKQGTVAFVKEVGQPVQERTTV
jgi:hypothetical protein